VVVEQTADVCVCVCVCVCVRVCVQVHVHRLVVVNSENMVEGIVSLSDILHRLVLAPLGQWHHRTSGGPWT